MTDDAMHDALSDPLDLCHDCKRSFNACTCEPDVCLYCNRQMEGRDEWPFCSRTCAIDAESYDSFLDDPRR